MPARVTPQLTAPETLEEAVRSAIRKEIERAVVWIRFPPIGVDVDGAVQATSLGRSTIYKAISSLELPARKLGDRTVILWTELEAWMRSLPKFGDAIPGSSKSPLGSSEANMRLDRGEFGGTSGTTRSAIPPSRLA
jgi:predicted DNA-binding transcriptional regulator AlpA